MGRRAFITLVSILACMCGRPALADSGADSGEEARALSQQTLSLIIASKFSDATALAQKGLTLCDDAGAFRRYCEGVFDELLGDAASAQSNYPDALLYYEKSLRSRQAQLGPDDRLVGIAQYKVGRTQAALHNNAAAEAALMSAAANFQKRTPVGQELGATLFYLAKLRAASGRYDDAVIAARRALDVYITIQGPDGKTVPVIRQFLDEALVSQSRQRNHENGTLGASSLAEKDARPPVGGVISPEGAMIFYLAHGQVGACGPNCSDWIAAEGIVEWDTFKRLFAFLEHVGDRKLPVVLNVRGNGNLNVATTLGKIIRDHGLDVNVGTTVVAECANTTEAACFTLKRGSGPLDARIDTTFVECDVVCVLILAGGVHRTLPANASVVIGGMQITNRLAPNVSKERQQGLQARYGDQFRLYLTQMGVNPEVVDIIDRNSQAGRSTQLFNKEWLQFGIVTAATP